VRCGARGRRRRRRWRGAMRPAAAPGDASRARPSAPARRAARAVATPTTRCRRRARPMRRSRTRRRRWVTPARGLAGVRPRVKRRDGLAGPEPICQTGDMAVLKVARLGHPVLRQVAEPVSPEAIGSPEIQRLIDDMLETMAEYDGAGLAAPQVHVSQRIVI